MPCVPIFFDDETYGFQATWHICIAPRLVQFPHLQSNHVNSVQWKNPHVHSISAFKFLIFQWKIPVLRIKNHGDPYRAYENSWDYSKIILRFYGWDYALT